MQKPLLATLLMFLFSFSSQAESCSDQKVSIQILGSGGPELIHGRASSSYLLWQDKQSLLMLDAGTGSKLRFNQAEADFNSVEAILFSHLHVDHSADLPAFIKAAYFSGRNKNLLVLGPSGNQFMPSTTDFVARLFSTKGAYPYLSDYLIKDQESFWIDSQNHITNKSETFAINNWQFTGLSVNHGPIPAVAWKLQSSDCSIVYAGDTSNRANKLAGFSKGANLLIVHMAIHESAGPVAHNLHMSPADIVNLVIESKPKRVLLSHFMSRSESEKEKLKQRLEKETPSQVVLAKDGMRLGL